MSRRLGIGEAAAALGVTADTLRYYERIGMVMPPARDGGGRRRYDDQDMKRLRFVLRAKRLGFTLDEISELVAFRRSPTTSPSRVRELVADKRDRLDALIADITPLRNELDILLDICDGSGDYCPIIDTLDRDQ